MSGRFSAVTVDCSESPSAGHHNSHKSTCVAFTQRQQKVGNDTPSSHFSLVNVGLAAERDDFCRMNCKTGNQHQIACSFARNAVTSPTSHHIVSNVALGSPSAAELRFGWNNDDGQGRSQAPIQESGLRLYSDLTTTLFGISGEVTFH